MKRRNKGKHNRRLRPGPYPEPVFDPLTKDDEDLAMVIAGRIVMKSIGIGIRVCTQFPGLNDEYAARLVNQWFNSFSHTVDVAALNRGLTPWGDEFKEVITDGNEKQLSTGCVEELKWLIRDAYTFAIDMFKQHACENITSILKRAVESAKGQREEMLEASSNFDWDDPALAAIEKSVVEGLFEGNNRV